MKNFEKPLKDFTEEELLARIDQWDPKYGVLGSYELLRRLALENSRSSKRFAKWSLGIAVVAILISISMGVIQTLKTQDVRITNEPLKTEVQSFR